MLVAEPPIALKPFLFTPDTAAIAGKRSGDVRRALSAFKRNGDKPPSADNVQLALNAQLVLVAEQIRCTRDVLNDTEYCYCEHCKRGGVEPHHRAQLLKALDTLLNRQRILLSVPDPGTSRPSKSKPSRSVPAPVPTATPQQVVTCAPDNGSNDEEQHKS